MKADVTEAKLKKAVETALENLNFHVTSEVPMGRSRADLIAQSGNRVLVFEFKVGDPSLQLPSGSLPQAIEINTTASQFYVSQEVHTVFLTNQFVPPMLAESFSASGVTLNTISGIDAEEIKKVIEEIGND
jgi:hypothetical protein